MYPLEEKYELRYTDIKADYKLRMTQKVLAARERELLDLKGACSNKTCILHYAHAGPCNEKL